MTDLAQVVSMGSERLLMRDYEPRDADAVWRVMRQRAVSEWMINIPHPYPRERVELWFASLEKYRRRGLAMELGVFLKQDGRYLGNCGLISIDSALRCCDVTYFMNPGDWGRGYAGEACRTMMDYGFAALNLREIRGRCYSDNVASRRVMEKCGMTVDNVIRNDIIKDGVPRDVTYLSVSREDFYKAEGRC